MKRKKVNHDENASYSALNRPISSTNPFAINVIVDASERQLRYAATKLLLDHPDLAKGVYNSLIAATLHLSNSTSEIVPVDTIDASALRAFISKANKEDLRLLLEDVLIENEDLEVKVIRRLQASDRYCNAIADRAQPRIKAERATEVVEISSDEEEDGGSVPRCAPFERKRLNRDPDTGRFTGTCKSPRGANTHHRRPSLPKEGSLHDDLQRHDRKRLRRHNLPSTDSTGQRFHGERDEGYNSTLLCRPRSNPQFTLPASVRGGGSVIPSEPQSRTLVPVVRNFKGDSAADYGSSMLASSPSNWSPTTEAAGYSTPPSSILSRSSNSLEDHTMDDDGSTYTPSLVGKPCPMASATTLQESRLHLIRTAKVVPSVEIGSRSVTNTWHEVDGSTLQRSAATVEPDLPQRPSPSNSEVVNGLRSTFNVRSTKQLRSKGEVKRQSLTTSTDLSREMRQLAELNERQGIPKLTSTRGRWRTGTEDTTMQSVPRKLAQKQPGNTATSHDSGMDQVDNAVQKCPNRTATTANKNSIDRVSQSIGTRPAAYPVLEVRETPDCHSENHSAARVYMDPACSTKPPPRVIDHPALTHRPAAAWNPINRSVIQTANKNKPRDSPHCTLPAPLPSALSQPSKPTVKKSRLEETMDGHVPTNKTLHGSQQRSASRLSQERDRTARTPTMTASQSRTKTRHERRNKQAVQRCKKKIRLLKPRLIGLSHHPSGSNLAKERRLSTNADIETEGLEVAWDFWKRRDGPRALTPRQRRRTHQYACCSGEKGSVGCTVYL